MQFLYLPFDFVTLFVFAYSQDIKKPSEATTIGKWFCKFDVVNGSSLPKDIVRELRLTLTEDRFKPRHTALGGDRSITFECAADSEALLILWKRMVP